MSQFIPYFLTGRRLSVVLSEEFSAVLASRPPSMSRRLKLEDEFRAEIILEMLQDQFQIWIQRRPFRRLRSPSFTGGLLVRGNTVEFAGCVRISRLEYCAFCLFALLFFKFCYLFMFFQEAIFSGPVAFQYLAGLLVPMFYALYLHYTFRRDYNVIARFTEVLVR